MSRPDLLVLVVGTATDVGKTWVGARTLAALRAKGMTVAARKPAQSFALDDPHPTDAEVLSAATGEEPSTVCPAHRSYPVAMAPPMAADVLGLPAPTLAAMFGPTAARSAGVPAAVCAAIVSSAWMRDAQSVGAITFAAGPAQRRLTASRIAVWRQVSVRLEAPCVRPARAAASTP